MAYRRLSESDFRFMSAVWDNEPVSSADLARVCEQTVGWKKSTTYTMLRRTTEKGFVRNDNSIITSLLKRDGTLKNEADYAVKNTFKGSFPGFVKSYLTGKKITAAEAEEVKKLIDKHIS